MPVSGMGSQWIKVFERDLSIMEPPLVTGHQGQFFILQTKGPVNTPILIQNQQEFEEIFGTQNPDITGHISSLVQYKFVYNFPQYIMRLQKNQKFQGQTFKFDLDNGSTQTQLTSSTQPTDLRFFSMDIDNNFQIFCKFPGFWGNRLKVKITPTSIMNSTDLNQFSMQVIDTIDNVILEQWTFVEDKNVIDENGNSLYIGEVLKKSKFVTVIDNSNKQIQFPIQRTNNNINNLTVEIKLDGGYEESVIDSNGTVDINQVKNQIEQFSDDENLIFDYIVSQGWTETQIHNQVISICERRHDCIQLLDQPDLDSSDSVVQFRNNQAYDTSYQGLFSPWLVVSNPYNGREIKVPPTYFLPWMYMNIDQSNGYHYQVQGFSRGRITQSDVTTVYRKQDRDVLYDNGVNPIQRIHNLGIYIWGNKTLQSYQSKLDRLTQRRVVSLQVIKPLKIDLKRFLFLPYNTDTLRELNIFLTNFVNDLIRSGQVEDQRFQIIQDDQHRNRNEIEIIFDLIPVGTLEYITLRINVYPSGGFNIQEI